MCCIHCRQDRTQRSEQRRCEQKVQKHCDRAFKVGLRPQKRSRKTLHTNSAFEALVLCAWLWGLTLALSSSLAWQGTPPWGAAALYQTFAHKPQSQVFNTISDGLLVKIGFCWFLCWMQAQAVSQRHISGLGVYLGLRSKDAIYEPFVNFLNSKKRSISNRIITLTSPLGSM